MNRDQILTAIKLNNTVFVKYLYQNAYFDDGFLYVHIAGKDNRPLCPLEWKDCFTN